jgi:PAS domain S-box-containing protein
VKAVLGAAVLSSVAGFFTQALAWPILSPHSWSLLFPTVFVAAWVGGAWSGAVAILISGVLDWWYFVPPERVLFKDDLTHLLGMAVYIALGLGVTVVQGYVRRANEARAAALAESERNNARLKQLLTQRTIFTALIENSSDFIGIADAQGTPLYVNPAGRRLVGLAPDFPVEDTELQDYYPPELRAFASEVIVKAMHEKGRLEGETYYRHWQTEHAIPVSYTHFMVREPQNGQVLGMATITREISQIKRIRDQLEASNRRQRFLAEAGAILASTLNYEEILTSLVRLAVRDFADLCSVDVYADGGEIRRLEVISRDPSLEWACKILRDTPPDRTRPHLAWSMLETRQTVLMETVPSGVAASFAQGNPERLRAIEATNPQSVIAVPLLARGGVIGILALVSSTPGRYGAEEVEVAEALALRAALAIENARLYRAAQRALLARDEVLGVVAHDLRNPLTSIVIHSELLEIGTRRGQPTHDDVAAIQRSAERMERMIRDLLDIACVEAGCLKVHRGGISATQLIREVTRNQSQLAAAMSCELRLELPPHLPLLWADHDRLLQVFENLLGNALKFTPRGGFITIRATPEEGEVLFSVADTGTGIGPDTLAHVFDRFWQASADERRGAGLGLTIVKAIVESHGGRVWVESTPGQGTTFFFTIPTAVQIAHSERAAPAA